MIQISSAREGFRRCGVAHPRGPVTYPDDHFSPEEMKILKAEPMLTVVEIEGEAVVANAPNFEAKTVPQLKKLLSELQVSVPKDAKKPELIALLQERTAKAPEA